MKITDILRRTDNNPNMSEEEKMLIAFENCGLIICAFSTVLGLILYGIMLVFGIITL